MKKALRFALLVVVLGALAGGGYWYYDSRVASASEATSDAGLTQIVTVERGTLSATLSVVGSLEAVQSADLAFAEMSGTAALLSLEVQTGQTVTAGQVLATIDAAPYQQVLDQASSDLAVIEVDVPADELHPVEVADSSEITVGRLAVAIGNPYGLEGTMTVGFISALGRSLAVDAYSTTASYTIPDIIQTDAPINPGNSGGVLVDDEGRLIGVPTAIESATGSNSGIGFAVPSTIVQKVVPALIDKGSVEYSWLGITGTSLTADLAEAMGLDRDQRGALVFEVTGGGPAEKAGLHGSDRRADLDGEQVEVGGDVIVAIDSHLVSDFDDLVSYLVGRTSVGDEVTLTILRDGKEQALEVTLASRPAVQESLIETIP